MQQTPLTQWHRDHHGRLVDFAGWEMPIQYSTIVEEHQAVRKAVGLFDISHMGRLYIQGEQATDFLNLVTGISVNRIQPGRIRYTFAMNEKGGVRDDILVYRLPDHFLVVVNASNRVKVLEAWQQRVKDFPTVEIRDATFDEAMIAIQGPRAVALLQQKFPGCQEMKYYHSLPAEVEGVKFLISRTGYTGEDGFEVIASSDQILSLWTELVEAAQAFEGKPCGLGCRDTLRLEAGMPLYGHELSEETDPVSAQLEFAVDMKKPDFLGRSALLEVYKTGAKQQRVGLELTGKRIAREHSLVLNQAGEQVGEVTSGTFSPTLQKTIAMAYVASKYSKTGTELTVDIRGTKVPAVVTGLPFYQRKKP